MSEKCSTAALRAAGNSGWRAGVGWRLRLKEPAPVGSELREVWAGRCGVEAGVEQGRARGVLEWRAGAG